MENAKENILAIMQSIAENKLSKDCGTLQSATYNDQKVLISALFDSTRGYNTGIIMLRLVVIDSLYSTNAAYSYFSFEEMAEKTEEIAEEIAEYGDNEHYSIWYENWNKDEEGNDVIPEEKEVEPFLNIYMKQVEIPISNHLIEAVGKLNMANYVVIANEDGTYATITEIGYMEIGDQFKTVFLPGEICQDLVAPNGLSLNAQYSVTATNYKSQPACAIFGDDVKCFGLMNDAIGYVVPDNDFTMGDPVNHYQELISLGKNVGSALMAGLNGIKNEIVRV